jgi:LysR family transcriptional regulator for metE and metH
LELRDLRLVAVVSEVGSLTRAAERLNVTQSALSHQLRIVEGRLGTPVFHRVGKRMVLTRAGQRLLETARHVLDEIGRAEDEIRGVRDPRHAVLRVTTECYTCYHWLPPLLADYRLCHPAVEVRIDLDATRDPLPRLLDGSLDLAIMSSKVSDRRLALTPLFRDDLTLVAAPGHHLAGKRRVRLADLADQTVFIYPPRAESTLLNSVLKPAGITPRVEEVPLTEAAIELVKAGLGVAALAHWAVRPELQAGRLVALPLPASALQRRWSAVMLRQAAAMPMLRDFVELLAATGRFQTAAGGV